MKRHDAISKLKSSAEAIRRHGVKALYLYGSTAKDKATISSDIDLFFDYDPKSKFNVLDLVSIKRTLEKLLGIDVDLTTRSGLHPLIRKRIEAEARRVF